MVVDPLTAPDLRLIALDKARRERRQQGVGGNGGDSAAADERVVEAMVAFNFRLAREAGPGPAQAYGRKGGPWEFNLRDVFRWAELQAAEAGAGALSSSSSSDEGGDAGAAAAMAAALTVETAYLTRLRERGDRRAARRAFEEVRE